MAVYQYYLAVIPKEGIQKRHELIPKEIGISTETGYFESDAELYWKEIDEKADELIPKIDSIVERADWGNSKTSFNWKTYTETLDNDAFMGLDEITLSISEFSFRADLRENEFTFLKNMIELGKENNWMFMDRKGKLMDADFEEIKDSIRNSNAHSFLIDPIEYLESLDDKNK
ncbi:hypothetical protein [uncultured Tenacibaculum sp.]|uniref:hypothetical protein n=1 Tax=uncultured Tenacibaculum sp. TaxID=174713 RepID=UPI0026178D93|nr:hypothetical protein [uncultured Tenacibaculum sp.]